MKRKLLLAIGGGCLLGFIGWFFSFPSPSSSLLSPLRGKTSSSSSGGQYHHFSFPALAQRFYSPSQIKLEKIIKKEEKYTSWLFSYLSQGKRVTGMANIPHSKGKHPVIIMLRGYADKEIYFTGLGTRKAAGVFAQNGFLTLAPDFLGFGDSDSESADILEARFTRPVTVLNLIASVATLPQADPTQIFLWGHSNGGQIALSVLEISGKPYPTTLWAPVTTPFPQSILQYLDLDNLTPESKKVVQALEDFTATHSPEEFSITNPLFLEKITAPLQLHQGERDPLIDARQQREFVAQLKKMGKKIIAYFYPQADHNLKPNWDEVVKKDIIFFTQNSVSLP